MPRPVAVAGVGGMEKRTRGAVAVEMPLLSIKVGGAVGVVDAGEAELRARPIWLIIAALSLWRDVWR